jgi:hypothetical protein
VSASDYAPPNITANELNTTETAVVEKPAEEEDDGHGHHHGHAH